MKPATIRKKLETHNRIKMGLTIAFALFSLLLFVISFYIVQAGFWFILGSLTDSAATYAFWIAVFYLIVQVFEGLRSAKYFFEQQSAEESFGTINDVMKNSVFHYERGWVYTSHLFSHFLLAAPYASLRALEESKKMAKPDDATLVQASNVMVILKRNPKRWTPIAQVAPYAHGLELLVRMGIVWVDSDENGDVCRIADH